MPAKKISELTAVASVTGSESLPVVQGASTVRAPLSAIADYVGAATIASATIAASAAAGADAAALQALAAAGIAQQFISETTSAPTTTGATEGVKGAMRLTDGSWQRLVFTGGAWVAAGAALVGTTGLAQHTANARVTPPAGFTASVPFRVTRSGGRFLTDFDPTRYRVAGKAYYVDGTSGADTNDGLTPHTALKNPATALAKSDIKVMYLLAGHYDRSKAIGTISKDLSVIGVGRVRVTSAETTTALSWVLDTDSTYKVTRSNTLRVLDSKYLDANGNYSSLTKRASVAEVNANAGSWFLDGSNVLYVRLSDGRAPDASVLVLLAGTTPLNVSGNATVYAEGIDFEGGGISQGVVQAGSTSGSARPRLILNRVTMKYGSGNGLAAAGAEYVYCVGCVAAVNEQDGFNYHAGTGTTGGLAVEIDCAGYGNGLADGTNNDNGSTSHEDISVVRVNCEYFGNVGPNVIDTNSSLSWNVGVEAYDSASTSAGLDFGFFAGNTTKMWLDSCYVHGNAVGLQVGDATATIYTRDVVNSGNVSATGGAGSVTSY